MHRIPEDTDTEILKNAQMILKPDEGEAAVFEPSSATVDFLYGANNQSLLEVKAGSVVSVEIAADNPEQIETVTLYRSFNKIETLSQAPFVFNLSADQPGKHTLNVEFLSKSGVKTAVHGDINVVED
jgi:hypothetical protein